MVVTKKNKKKQKDDNRNNNNLNNLDSTKETKEKEMPINIICKKGYFIPEDDGTAKDCIKCSLEGCSIYNGT